jgi:Ca2+-binding RTX toxin-like protein
MPVLNWGREQVVGTTDDSINTREADVAGLADGGYVVVWEDASATQHVLAQRYDALGHAVGARIVVDGHVSGDPALFAPQVTATADGGFAITVADALQGGDAMTVFYSADGVANGGLLGAGSNAFEGEAAVAGFNDTVLWAFRQGDDISVWLGFSGTRIVANNETLAGLQRAPSIAGIDHGGRFVVTWLDQQSNFSSDYHYRVFAADGTAVSGTHQVNNSPGVAESGDVPASVVGLANGGFVIAWHEFSTALQDQNSFSVHAKIYDADGTQVVGEFVVNATFKNFQAFPDLVALPDGGFVAVWSDSSAGAGETDYNIAGQMFDAFGARVGRQFTVNTGTDGASGEFWPHIAALADGRLVVEWHSAATGQIRTQIIDPRDGVVTGTEKANTLYGHDLVGDEINGLGGGDTLNGLGGGDALYGGDGNDVLRGGAGADRLDGGAGTDTASWFTSMAGVSVNLVSGIGSSGEAQGDTLVGIENLTGSQGNDSLVGNAGANALNGSAGNDALTGAGGKDTLTGGLGADRFVYGNVVQSPVGAGADAITDFSRAQGDRIDLSAIDADATAAGNQAFRFISGGLYTGHAGELRFAQANGVTTIAGDVNGDKVSDFHIILTGTIALVAGDFVL